MDWSLLLFNAFSYILPAYVCNSAAALYGGKKPLDLGKKWKGRRILGNGKTFRGTFFGFVFGVVTAALIGIVLDNVYFYLPLGVLLITGALVGDTVSSFFKRRAGLKRGRSVPLLDQWDFVFGAAIFGSVMFIPSLETFVFLLIVTPVIHLSLNAVSYLLKMKAVPW